MQAQGVWTLRRPERRWTGTRRALGFDGLRRAALLAGPGRVAPESGMAHFATRCNAKAPRQSAIDFENGQRPISTAYAGEIAGYRIFMHMPHDAVCANEDHIERD